MLVLALDTTTRAGSCAVARDGVVLRERAGDASRSHDTRLPRDLMVLLDEARLALRDIDLFAAATGPGSFTGLRVGIAAMQGLAFAAGKPLSGVSAFDALAQIAMAGQGPEDHAVRGPGDPPVVPRRPPADASLTRSAGDPSPGAGGALSPARGRSACAAARVATWVDAWRGEVYAALYEDGREIEPPTVEHPRALLARYARQLAGPAVQVFIGDAAGVYRDVIIETLNDRARIAEPAAPCLAGMLAILATDSARAGHRPPPHAIRPLYVRRPDAELARNARHVR